MHIPFGFTPLVVMYNIPGRAQLNLLLHAEAFLQCCEQMLVKVHPALCMASMVMQALQMALCSWMRMPWRYCTLARPHGSMTTSKALTHP